MADPRLTGTILDYAEHAGAGGDVAHRRQYNDAAGVKAQHPVGVRYQGPWDQVADGFHEHVRRQARALSLTGCPVHLTSMKALVHYGVKAGSEEEKVLLDYKDLIECSMGKAGVIVQQTVPSEGQLQRLTRFSQGAMLCLTPEDMARMYGARVMYTVWERSPAPPDDVAALNLLGQAWVGCQENRAMLIDSGVTPDKCRVVPLPYFHEDPLLALDGRPRTAPKGVVRFYHIGKWEPRKDQNRIIGNWLREFRPGEAELFLKTSPFSSRAENYPDGPLESVKRWMAEDPGVISNGWVFPATADRQTQARLLGQMGLKIYEMRLSLQQMRALHATCDVYVTLSHGEGFDMPAFDSKLAGNLMVYTPSGGPQDFAGEHDERVPELGRVGCHPLYRWREGSTYLDYSDCAAGTALRRAHESALTGRRARGRDLSPFSAASVGKLMLGYLRELADLPGEA